MNKEKTKIAAKKLTVKFSLTILLMLIIIISVLVLLWLLGTLIPFTDGYGSESLQGAVNIDLSAGGDKVVVTYADGDVKTGELVSNKRGEQYLRVYEPPLYSTAEFVARLLPGYLAVTVVLLLLPIMITALTSFIKRYRAARSLFAARHGVDKLSLMRCLKLFFCGYEGPADESNNSSGYKQDPRGSDPLTLAYESQRPADKSGVFKLESDKKNTTKSQQNK